MFKENPYDIFPDYEKYHQELSEIANAGYTLILHAHFWKSKFVYTTYPKRWVELYDRNHFVIIDPIMLWTLTNTGTIRWSDVKSIPKVAVEYVMSRAKDFGLNYGATAVARSKHMHNKKCIISVARSDREVTDEEMARVAEILDYFLDVHDGRLGLTDIEVETIQDLAWGYSQEEIANKSGVSRETIKKRVLRIRKKVGARNATHAVTIALTHSLIEAK